MVRRRNGFLLRKTGENLDSSDVEEEEYPDSTENDEGPEVPEEDTTSKQSAKGRVKRRISGKENHLNFDLLSLC